MRLFRCAASTVVLCSALLAQGQGGARAAGTVGEKAGAAGPIPLKLHYGEPKTYAVGSRRSALIGDPACDSDGVVYVSMAEDVTGELDWGAMEVVGLLPSGEIVRYRPKSITGYRGVSSTAHYFVSNSRLYMLEVAEKLDPSNPLKQGSLAHPLQVFDRKGNMTSSFVLEPGVEPSNVAAFDSGEIVIFFADRQNQTSRLALLDAAGVPESTIQLFDADVATRLKLANKGDQGEALYATENSSALDSLLTFATLLPRGGNLLLQTSRANLPLIEFNQHGWVREIPLAFPEGMTAERLLPSNDGLLHVSAGAYRLLDPKQAKSDENPRIFQPREIDVFSPTDGSLVRRVLLAPGMGPQAVCAVGGAYSFVVPRETDGRLQVIQATPIF